MFKSKFVQGDITNVKTLKIFVAHFLGSFPTLKYKNYFKKLNLTLG